MQARTFGLRPRIGGCVPGFAAWALALVGLLLLARAIAPPPAAVVLFPMLVGSIVTLVMWPPTVRVGADGLWIGRLGRRTFIPIGDIESVEWIQAPVGRSGGPVGPGLVVKRRTAPAFELPLLGLAVFHRDELRAAIETAIAGAAAPRSRSLAALDRAGRSLDRWRKDLEALVRGGFREGALTREELVEILDDPQATTEHRVGAALALRGAMGEPARARIRTAAERSAEPRLRVALTLAADDEEAFGELEATLDAAPKQPRA